MADEDILHQDDVEGVIEDTIEEGIGENQEAITNLAPASVAYVQAEATATRTTVNAILDVLRNAGMIDAS